MMLKLKLQYFGHLMRRVDSLEKTGGEGDDRGWDGWMASLTRWMWVSVNSGSWWWTGRPGMLRFMGSWRIGHDWATELNWTELNIALLLCIAVCSLSRIFVSVVHEGYWSIISFLKYFVSFLYQNYVASRKYMRNISIFNGYFNVSVWPNYISQLCNQKVICVLLCRYFVDVIEVHYQLILSRDNYPT